MKEYTIEEKITVEETTTYTVEANSKKEAIEKYSHSGQFQGTVSNACSLPKIKCTRVEDE